MQINIAIPDNNIYSPFISGEIEAAEKYNLRIIKTSDKECRDMMKNNIVQAALLSPLGYGMGVKIADYRIIPGLALSSYGFTGIASIVLKQGAKKIEKAASPTPDDFMMLIGKMLLAERYNLHPDLVKKQGSADELLKDFDAAIVWGSLADGNVPLDISEDWFDTFEIPLPMAFWTCRAEEYPENIVDIVKELSVDAYVNKEAASGEEVVDPDDMRPGKISWDWNAEIEDALEQTLGFLYYHQYFPEMPGVKLLGRD